VRSQASRCVREGMRRRVRRRRGLGKYLREVAITGNGSAGLLPASVVVVAAGAGTVLVNNT